MGILNNSEFLPLSLFMRLSKEDFIGRNYCLVAYDCGKKGVEEALKNELPDCVGVHLKDGIRSIMKHGNHHSGKKNPPGEAEIHVISAILADTVQNGMNPSRRYLAVSHDSDLFHPTIR